MEAIKKAAITVAMALSVWELLTAGDALALILSLTILNMVYGKAMYKAWYKFLTH